MRTLLPLVTKREIAREMRLGALRTDDAVLRTLRTNHALSKGLAGQRRASTGRLNGAMHLYCALNRDAARAAPQGQGPGSPAGPSRRAGRGPEGNQNPR